MIGKEQQGQLIKGDDSAFLKQIQATHAPDGRYIDCKPILKMAEEIFNLAMAEMKPTIGTSVQTEAIAATEQEECQQGGDSDLVVNNLSPIISGLIVEVAYVGGVDLHSKTMSVLNSLSIFSWEAKLVLTLYAVALSYGKCLLLTEVYLSDKLPEPMAILKRMADVCKRSDMLRSRFSELNNLIIPMLDLAKCIVGFRELHSMSSSLDVESSSIAIDTISSASYWNIRGALACALNISQLNSMGLEGITSASELWELSALAQKMRKMKEQLQNQLALFRKHIEEKMQRDAYEALVLIIGTRHIDNLEVLKALLCVKEDEPPLYDDSKKTMVNLDVLRKKNVLLLISGLNIAQDPDLIVVHHIYEESRTDQKSVGDQHELVWVPILDPSEKWTSEMEKILDSNRSTMPWYSLNQPKTINPPVIKLIRERFNYHGHPILVVLDPQGVVVNTNAIDMIWIWGNHAFPYSQAREEELWKGEMLGFDLLVDGIHPDIENSVKEGKYTVIYGGDHIEWFREFVKTTHQAKQATNIPLEILYVGKSNTKEQEMNRLLNLIKDESLGHFLPDINMIWLFWNRLEHMKRSKIRLLSCTTIGEDPVLQGITKLLSYDQIGRWAALFKGKEVVVTGHGDAMLPSMKRYLDAWQEHANKGFDVAFKEYFDNIQAVDIPPVRMILPSSFYETVNVVLCPECSRSMEKYILFNCNHGMQ